MTCRTNRTLARCWRVSFAALLVLVLAILYILPAGSAVWATPQQSPLRQTIPTLTPTPLPSWIWVSQIGGNPVDYAPSGMPDLDQRQNDWRDAQSTVWTHCGPLAVANALWWLDSISESGGNAPPEISDGYPLLSSFGLWDDHDAQNVIPLVNELANYLDTNGMRTGSTYLGTNIMVLGSALQSYIADQDLADSYVVSTVASPSFEQLLTWVRGGDVVILLLGFWEWQGDRWVYLGGHYVTVAGVEPSNQLVAISDPFRDAFEAGRVVIGRSPESHPYPHTADVHNDVRYVSHDAYSVVSADGPGGVWALDNYVLTYEDVQGFIGQNLVPIFESYRGYYGGADITTKADYAVIVSHRPYMLYLPIVLKGAL